MPQGASSEPLLSRLVARAIGADPESLHFRPCPTGKFNTTCFVEGGPTPLVLRIAPPDDRSRMLFYEHRMMRQEPALHALLREPHGDALGVLDELMSVLGLPGAALLGDGPGRDQDELVEPDHRVVARFDALMMEEARHRAELEEESP